MDQTKSTNGSTGAHRFPELPGSDRVTNRESRPFKLRLRTRTEDDKMERVAVADVERVGGSRRVAFDFLETSAV